MKNVKSTKTLMSFSDSSMNLSEMKKVQGGQLCAKSLGLEGFIACLQQH